MHVSSIDGKIFMFKRRCVQIKANDEQILSRAKKDIFNCEYWYSMCLQLRCRWIRLQDVITYGVILCILQIPVLSLSHETGFPGPFLYLQ
jgi:hypothetical protein